MTEFIRKHQILDIEKGLQETVSLYFSVTPTGFKPVTF